MNLSDHDLSQLDEEYLRHLSEEELLRVSTRLLDDLKAARERLSQNSRNSSRPPRSDAPWDKAGSSDAEEPSEDSDDGDDPNADDQEEKHGEEEGEESRPNGQDDTSAQGGEDDTSNQESRTSSSENSKRPGKQPGAPGFGREQKLPITGYEEHTPTECHCCGRSLNPVGQAAWTAYYTVDIDWSDERQPGIRLLNTKHIWYEIRCECGHMTREEPHRSTPCDLMPEVENSEWRLVGEGLAALIVCLSYRMRLSRSRIQEFLHDWFGLKLAVGTIHNTLQECGAAAMPLEETLVQEIVESDLLHADETSWRELTTGLWLWVFCTKEITAFWIAHRTDELIKTILGEAYAGWLMSDGYRVYRRYSNRIRCWAHLMRKARGLEEALTKEARQFGQETLELMGMLIGAIREAREKPPDKPLPERYQAQLEAYRRRCEQMKESSHEKSRQLAVEMLNDWEAIFRVLEYPFLPLTNNEAERALRHWVILRSICHGTRTGNGSRSFAILISVTETCRKRGQSPWLYLAAVTRSSREGKPIPALPPAKGSE